MITSQTFYSFSANGRFVTVKQLRDFLIDLPPALDDHPIETKEDSHSGHINKAEVRGPVELVKE